jgi:glutamine synthetase type III
LCENEILDEHAESSIKEHFTNLELNFERYFPSFNEAEHKQKLWLLNPFDDNAIEQAGISEEIKEQRFVLSTDTVLKMRGMGLDDAPEFWQKMKVEYEQMSNMARTDLLPFAATYLCEASFSATTELKTKLRNRMSPENDLIVALSSLKPWFENLISTKQAQISH